VAKKTRYQKDITRINERLYQVGKTFGKEDTTYQSIVSYLSSIGANTHETTKGYIAISQSEKSKLTEKQVTKLLSFSTVGEKIKRGRKSLKKRGVKKPTRKKIIEHVMKSSKIKQFIKEHEQEIYSYKELYQAVKRRKDENNARLYEDEVIELFNLIGEPMELEEYKDIFESEKIIK